MSQMQWIQVMTVLNKFKIENMYSRRKHIRTSMHRKHLLKIYSPYLGKFLFGLVSSIHFTNFSAQ